MEWFNLRFLTDGPDPLPNGPWTNHHFENCHFEGLTFGDLSQLAVMDENGNLRAATTADLTDMTLHMPRLDALSAAEIDYSVTVD